MANHWAGEGRRVGVVTLAGPEGDFFKLGEGVTRMAVGGIGDAANPLDALMRNFRRVRTLRAALKRFNGHTAVGFIGPTNVLLLLAARGLGYRVVVCERNDPARQSFGRAWDLARRWLYRSADVITANSRGALDTMRAYAGAAKLVYLPNPVRRPAVAAAPTAREPVFLNVGRLHRQKGQDILIAAFARIASELPDWRLVIVGEGPARGDLDTRHRGGRPAGPRHVDRPDRRSVRMVCPRVGIRVSLAPRRPTQRADRSHELWAAGHRQRQCQRARRSGDAWHRRIARAGRGHRGACRRHAVARRLAAKGTAMGEAGARKVAPYALERVVAAWDAVVWPRS